MSPGRRPVPSPASVGVVHGGGELGTAAALALRRAGLAVLVLERPLPGALRLGVSFATAVVEGRMTVDGVTAVRCDDDARILTAWQVGHVAVVTVPRVPFRDDPDHHPAVWVDARMRRLTEPIPVLHRASVVIGIGPGFVAGRDVHFVVESQRGPGLGRVIREGAATPYTGVPGRVQGHTEDRVLRAPRTGTFRRARRLGDWVEEGTVVGWVAGAPVVCRLGGMIRGLKLSGVPVGAGHKVGDVDPRRDRALLHMRTDKSRAVERGVLEALRQSGWRWRAPPGTAG